MMFVSWSDQNNILIYRTLEEFKRFHVSEYLPEITSTCWGGMKELSIPTHCFVLLLERTEEKIPH